MAKGKKSTSAKRGGIGGGDTAQQIANLESECGAQGVKRARELSESENPSVIKLAFKYVRSVERASGPQGLGKRMESLLAMMPESEANAMRAKLLAAKAEAAKK